MADTEFEEFRDHFETLPQHIKAPIQCYTLVHDVILDESPKDDIVDTRILSSASKATLVSIDNDDDDEEDDDDKTYNGSGNSSLQSLPNSITSTISDEDNSHKETKINKCCMNVSSSISQSGITQPRQQYYNSTIYNHHCISQDTSTHSTGDSDSQSRVCWSEKPPLTNGNGGTERRRRKLPELPKNAHLFDGESGLTRMFRSGRDEHVRMRRKLPDLPKSSHVSLAEELGEASMSPHTFHSRPQSLLMLKCHSYLRDEDSSPEVDSGNSTANSPDGPKSTSPQTTINNGSVTPISASSSASLPFTQLELMEATHRGLYKFLPRHRDELEIDIGDPIYVQKEADDLWCEGVNLRTGQQGVFPSAYAVDVEYNDFDPTTPCVKRERFLLGYLGSVETLCHKGNGVLCQAVKKIVNGTKDHRPHSCILEISDQGLRMVDKSKPKHQSGNGTPCHDYFYSLKNVSFCGFHPGDHRYLGFITKHPHYQRFACHVFLGCESTRPVAESVGRAFQRFYTKFIETAYPIEDIYIE